MKNLWRHFLAYMHWSDSAVCEFSQGEKDYHDYCDDEWQCPLHGVTLTCVRCGKNFSI